MEPKCVRVWDLTKLSAQNRVPNQEHNISSTDDTVYRCMDLNHNGTQLLLSQYSSLCPIHNGHIKIYNLTNNTSYQKIVPIPVGGVKFFGTNAIITANNDSVCKWTQTGTNPTIIPMPISKKESLVPSTIATNPEKKIFAFIENKHYYGYKDYICKSSICFDDSLDYQSLDDQNLDGERKIIEKSTLQLAQAQNDISDERFFTNSRSEHLIFIIYALKQLPLPKETRDEIISKIEQSLIAKINTESIDGIVYWAEYSPDAHTIALTAEHNTYIIEPSIENKNCITTMPVTGYSTFHPNSRTLFTITRDGKALYGIDLKTKKLMYKHNFTNKILTDAIPGEHNQLLAFNGAGDKLAVSFYSHCQVYDVPESLQYFFNTYDGESVPEIIIEPKKDTTVFNLTPQPRKPKSQDNCAVQ